MKAINTTTKKATAKVNKVSKADKERAKAKTKAIKESAKALKQAIKDRQSTFEFCYNEVKADGQAFNKLLGAKITWKLISTKGNLIKVMTTSQYYEYLAKAETWSESKIIDLAIKLARLINTGKFDEIEAKPYNDKVKAEAVKFMEDKKAQAQARKQARKQAEAVEIIEAYKASLK